MILIMNEIKTTCLKEHLESSDFYGQLEDNEK